MNANKPEYHLASVFDDGSSGEPQVLPLTEMPWDAAMGRRGALAAGLGFAGLLTALTESASAQTLKNEVCAVPAEGLRSHTDDVLVLAVSPRWKILASGSSDKTVKLWSLPGGSLLKTLSGHQGAVRALAVSPDGEILASGSLDKTVKLWSLPGGNPLKTLDGHKDAVHALAISPDGKILASGSSDGTVKLWSLPGGNLLKTLDGHKRSVQALAISPDGKILASGSSDYTVKLWSLPGGDLLKTLDDHKHWVNALAVSPDGKILASGSSDYSVKLWSLPGGDLLKTFDAHKDSVEALAVSPDGKILASGGFDQTVKLWSLPGGNLLKTLDGHKNSVQALALSPDGKVLASGELRGTVFLWNLLAEGGPCFQSTLFDPAATPSSFKGASYNVFNQASGQVVTYTLPCGSPIPTGATCTCNCVPGTYVRPTITAPSSGTRTICTCNKICVCIPISSRRWKQNIRQLTGAIDQISDLQAVRFDWSPDAPKNHSGADFGFIAEEVARVIPEVVPLDASGEALGVDYARLTVLLVEAVQSQQQQIEQLRGEIRTLREERSQMPSSSVRSYS